MKDVNFNFDTILNQALQLPGAKVKRADFLKKNLEKYCSAQETERAINSSVNEEVSGEVLEKLARSTIKEHTIKVTAISTLTGMPGGLAMATTIPADLVQYYFHVIVLAQKLAYIYGYPQFEENEDVDENLAYHLMLFIGVMYEVDKAHEAVLSVSKSLAAKTLSRVPEVTLKETGYYILRKNIARWVGLTITKKIFSQGVSKVIPVVSGFISGGVSYYSYTPMAHNLKVTLEEGYRKNSR